MASNTRDFDEMIEQANRDFSKKQRELFRQIERKNITQQRLLDNWQRTNDANVKAHLEELMARNEGEIADAIKQLRVGASSFWEDWSKEERKNFLTRIKDVEKESDTVVNNIRRVRGDLEDTLDDLSERTSRSITERMNEISDGMREWADSFNLSAIQNALQEQVDSYVQNLRDMRVSTGDIFDEKEFGRQVSNIVTDMSSYNRAEASEFYSEFMRNFGFKDMEEAGQFGRDLASATKGLGTTLDSYSNLIWRDEDNMMNGRLIRSINNVAAEMEDTMAYVKGNEVVEAINEKINDIYGLSVKDFKRQKGLIESVAAIQALQDSMVDNGVTAVAENLQRWFTMSAPELERDEGFQYYTSLTGIGAQDFQRLIQEPGPEGKKFVVSALQEALKPFANDQYAMTGLVWADGSIFENYADANSFATADTEEMLGYIEQAVNSVDNALVSTDNGEILTDSKEDDTVGVFTKFANDFMNNPLFNKVADTFSEFDVTTANLANLTIVGSALFKGGSKFARLFAEGGRLAGVGSRVSGFFGGLGGRLSGLLGGAGGAGVLGKLLTRAGPLAGLVGLALDGFTGTGRSVDWLGEERGNTASGKFSSFLGSALGGKSSGLKGAAGGALKGAAIGMFAGPIGAAIGGGIGAVLGAVGGERIAKAADAVFTGAKNIFNRTGDFIREKFLGITTSIKDGIGNVFSKAKNFFFGDRSKDTEYEDVEGVGRMRGYAKGITDIPNDGVAYLHSGEMVVPEKYADLIRGKAGFDSGVLSSKKDTSILSELYKLLNKRFENEDKEQKGLVKEFAKNGIMGSFLARINLNSVFGNFTKGIFKFSGSKGGILKRFLTGSGRGSSFLGNLGSKVSGLFNFLGGAVSSIFSGSTGGTGGAGGSTGLGGAATGTGGMAGGGSGLDILAPHPNPEGSGVDRWRPYVVDALQANGLSTDESMVNKVLKQITTESNGNPKAQNNWDSNAKKGTPSRGLLQTIDSTFNAYKFTGHDDIWNGYDNMLAAINYAKNRYGGGKDVMSASGKGMGSGHGYAVGTPWIPNDQVALIHQGEMIVPADVNPMNNPNNYVSASGQDNSEVVDTLRWQVSRLEAKLDVIIGIMSNRAGSRRRYTGVTDTDIAFSTY